MPSSEATVMANETTNDKAPVVNGTETLPKPGKPSDVSTSFLRAARAGQLDKVLQLIEQGVQINTSNANGLNALHLAAKDGHVEIVEELLTRGCHVDAATRKGNTALHIAALAGQEEVARALVGAGAQVNAQSSSGFTPLYMAAQEGHHAVVSFLLSKGANQGLSTEDGFTPLAVAMQQGHDKVVAVLLENDSRGKVRLPALHIAAKKDDTKAATLLLQNDHNPDVTSKSGFTPLHIAAHYGNQNIANLLLQKGADINFAAKHNITPLHVACKWGKVAMVGLLADRGANIECRTRDGLTPLHCAARSGHEQVLEQLIEAKAPLAAKTKNGLSALHMAAQGDHVEAARVLLYHGAPVDDITVDYLTALHVAAHCGHVPISRLLLDKKADPNARALNGFTPLHIACKKNRVKVVELLLKYGGNIEATTESGLTPLHVSCFMGCLNIAALLLNAGATPDASTVRGETPLHLAARANQADLVRLLLRHNATVDSRAREDQTPLHVASRLGNTDIAALLLEHGASPHSTTTDLYTPLHIAAKENQLEIAEQLLDHGAGLDAATKKGFTPLHLAAKYGNLEIARLLLDKQAPIDAQGKNGVSPLHVASHYDKDSVGLLLLERGASPHATAKNGFTPLHIAAKKNQMEIGKALLKYGARPNAESKAGFTPLHLASQEGHEKFAALLLEHTADPNQRAKNGLTPLHLCAQEDKVNVATVLGQHNAEIDATTKGGYTPLHVACHYGQVGMVRWLVNQSAKVDTSTSLGYSPLHQAAQQGHSLVITILLKAGADPNAQANNGLTPLAIANKLGYITVIETLKEVTTVTTITTVTQVTATTTVEEKYRVVAPEAMQETFMSDSEDDTGEDLLGSSDHHHYRYMAGDDMKSLRDDSARDFHQDDHHHYRESYVSSTDVMAELHVRDQHTLGTSQPDNVDIVRTPVHVGKQWTNFLVSFLVDARGGAMRGCRRSGINIVVPPKAAPAPLRLTCRYLRNRPGVTPPLSEAQALATRVLEFSPAGTVFLGPIIIEVPHFVSLRGKERELVVMRSEDGTTWKEQSLEGSENAVQDILNTSFEGDRVLRVVTTSLPQYLAVVSRLRQEVHAVGPDGGIVASSAVPDVQAVFPPNALTKKIKVGLQAQPISSEVVSRLFGNRVAVSAIVTVEPRRRKFHKPITLSLPLPTPVNRPGNYTGDNPSLRLLCSITGGNAKAQWEDVTGSTPLTPVKDSVSFTTTVSARFWLMDCRPVSQASAMASQLYHEAAHVPFMAKFVVYAKRIDQTEAKLRIFVMTDDREEKTLEHQEQFVEVAKSRDVEVVEGKALYVECLGNLVPVTKSGEQPSVVFCSFKENRISLTVRLRHQDERAQARLLFMSSPRATQPSQPPVCTLNIALPESDNSLLEEDTAVRGNIVVSELCEAVGEDWEALAQALGLCQQDIQLIAHQADTSHDRADLALKLWTKTGVDSASGNKLEGALRAIGRRDLVERCTVDTRDVTTDRAMAELTLDGATLDQSGFQSLTDELTFHKTNDSERIDSSPEPVKEVPLESGMDVISDLDVSQGKYEWEEKSITADFLAHETVQPSPPLNGTNGFEPGEWKNGKALWRSPSSEGIRDDCLYVSERGQMSSDSESGVLISGVVTERKQRHHTNTAGSSSGSDVALHEGLSDSEHGSDLQESLPHNGSHSEINQVMVLP